MEKGDKKKPAKKKIIKQKQKQKQEQKQTVIVNVNEPIKKPKKRKIYKPRNIKTIQPPNPIKTITSYQIPTERAEVYRPIQQPAPYQQQQQPPIQQQQKPAPAPAPEQVLRSKSELIYDDPLLRSKSELIYEESPLISISRSGGLLEEDNKLKLLKEKIKKVNYTLDTFNENAEIQHDDEIRNNSTFYTDDVYNQGIEAERIDEIEGSGAGEYSVQAPVFTTSNLFNDERESEKIEESGALQFLSKISDIIEGVMPDIGAEQEERQRKRAERAEIERIKDAERMERNRREQEMLATGLYRLEGGKFVLIEPELQPILQEGGALIPTKEQEGLVVGGGLYEEIPSGREDIPSGREDMPEPLRFTKDMIIMKRQEYIDLLNESEMSGDGNKQEASLNKYKQSAKEQTQTAMKQMYYDYARKINEFGETYEAFKQLETGGGIEL